MEISHVLSQTLTDHGQSTSGHLTMGRGHDNAESNWSNWSNVVELVEYSRIGRMSSNWSNVVELVEYSRIGRI